MRTVRALTAAALAAPIPAAAAVQAVVEACPPPRFPLGAVSFTIAPGSADCGGAGLQPPAAPPFSGEVAGANGKIADLALGCFHLGGGRAVNLPAARLPDGSTSLLDIATVNGLSLGLSASDGTSPANCTRGAGPLRHCLNGAPGTDGAGLCTSDADCGEGVGNCQLDANCLFGAPIPVPNPRPALSACRGHAGGHRNGRGSSVG